MGDPIAVALRTDDRRLAAAVVSSLEELGLRADEGAEAGRGIVALVDTRGTSPSGLLAPWVEAGARPVAIIADLAHARDALEQGAHDVVVADRPGEIALRAWMALQTTATPAAGARVRKLVRHDMRGPLAVLLGQCEILSIGLGGSLTDKQHRSVEAMDRKARELQAMIDHLADELGEMFGWEASR